jgi:hypothetical protein
VAVGVVVAVVVDSHGTVVGLLDGDLVVLGFILFSFFDILSSSLLLVYFFVVVCAGGAAVGELARGLRDIGGNFLETTAVPGVARVVDVWPALKKPVISVWIAAFWTVFTFFFSTAAEI